MKSKLLKTMLSFIVVSTLSFTAVGCGSNTNETETTEVVKVTEDSEVEDEETTEADADSILSVVDDIENSGSEVAESIKTTEPEVTAESTDTQAQDNTQVQQNTQATTSTEPAKTNNSGSSNKGTTTSNKSGSTSNSGSGSSTPAHQHNWKAVYRTVHHDAVTHTEDQGHYEDRGYSVSRYKCSTCGQKFDSLEELQAHRNVSRETYRDNPDMWHGGSSTINEWVSNNVWVSNIVTVTDSPAWDEQVLDHYECSCGATK